MGPWYPLSILAAIAATKIASPFSAKLRQALRGRRGLRERIAGHRFSESPYWFHVASSGEFEQVIPILEAVKTRAPRTPIFLSYFSPTAKRALELESERRQAAGIGLPWDYSDFVPFDLPWRVGPFIDDLNPRCFVAIHREIWPAMLEACRARKIPCYLFGTYVAPDAQNYLRRLRPWLGHFRAIGTNGDSTTNFLKTLFPENGPQIKTLGDPRVERVLKRKARGRVPVWRDWFTGRKTAIFASVWESDFKSIVAGLDILTAEKWRTLIVPHEIEGKLISDIEGWYAERGEPIRRWSDWLTNPDLQSHLIVDKVGFLAELYQVADLVFVGGSFKKRIHNVLEPAAYGTPIITGPFIDNSGEAVEMSREKPGLVRTQDAESFANAVEKLVGDDAHRRLIGQNLINYLNHRDGAGNRYADLLNEK